MWCKVDDLDLWDGETRAVTVGGRAVLLVKTRGVVRAFEDRCPHQGIPLSRGTLVGCTLTCWAHGWQFDVESGQGTNPRTATLTAVPSRISEGALWLDVDQR